MMITTHAAVRDFGNNLDALKADVLEEFVRLDYETPRDEISRNIDDFFLAVTAGEVHLSMDREICDLPIDILEWMLESN